MLLLGAGPRALLLQLAHPGVAAGVAEHSDFRADPWRRLDGTLRSYLRIIYGSTTAARDEIRRLNTLHRGIHGPGYDARDPALSLWVHATLVDSTVVVNDAWSGPVARDQAARFYDETKPIARAFGVPDAVLPPDLDAFEAYLDRQLGPGGPVQVGSTARELAEAILHPPLPGVLARLGAPPAPLRLDPVAVDRPPAGRDPGRLRPAVGTAANGACRRWLVAGWRAWNPVLPAVVPADAAGARRRSPGQRRALSRRPGTAAGTASTGRRASRRRAS